MRISFALLLVLFAVPGLPVHVQSASPLRLVQAIPLPDVEKRIDHMAGDVSHQRLFVAALGNNTLEVLDLRAGKRIHTVHDLHEPQGIGYVPKANRLFVANAQGGTCAVFDAASYKPVDSASFSSDADNIRYDAQANHLYVGYGEGALGILDAASGKRLGNVPLSGHPESFQLEQNGARIFVNVPTAGHIAVVDRTKRAVIATWALTGARSNFPMALDEGNHRLFIGCRNPAKVLVYSTDTGKTVTALEIAGDTDDLFYDAARKRLYVSCGAGFLDVLQQKDADHYTSIARIPTASGARTSLFVPELERLYLAVPHRGSQKAEIRVYAVEK